MAFEREDVYQNYQLPYNELFVDEITEHITKKTI